jgi:hypothetical protein
VSEFVSLHPSTPNASPQPWTRGLDPDDINLLHRKLFHISLTEHCSVEVSTPTSYSEEPSETG